MQTVSVVIPCYNGANFLLETLESALNQTHPPLEVIVIDDGSTDDSATIAESFGPPVRVIRQENQGESVARNRGIAEAKGTYVLFLDADDLLAPQALEKLSNLVEKSDSSIAVMGVAYFETDTNNPIHTRVPGSGSFQEQVISGPIAPIHCCLTPVELIRKVGGFDTSIRQLEDWDFWIRLAFDDATLHTTEFVGAFYRQHSIQQTKSSPAIDRCLGYSHVYCKLIQAALSNEEFLNNSGSKIFWCGWEHISLYLKKGLSWGEISVLCKHVERLSKRISNPSLTEKMVSIIGVRSVYLLKVTLSRT